MKKELKKDRIAKLKLPADPRELLDLYEVKDKIKLFQTLQDNLQTYVIDYMLSFLKTWDQVLAYIPLEDHDKYIRYPSNVPKKHLVSKTLADVMKTFKTRKKESDIYFLVNVKEKHISKFGTLSSPWTSGGYVSKNWTYKLNDDTLIVQHHRKHHSPFSRGHREIVLSYTIVEIHFDVSTNTFLEITTRDGKPDPYSFGSFSDLRENEYHDFWKENGKLDVKPQYAEMYKDYTNYLKVTKKLNDD